MRPFPNGLITAGIIYPLLLGITLLSSYQLPPNILPATAFPYDSSTHQPTYANLNLNPANFSLHLKTRSLSGDNLNVLAGSRLKSTRPDDNLSRKLEFPVFLTFPVQDGPLRERTDPGPSRPLKALQERVAEPVMENPKVAIIVDDAGYTPPETEEMLKLLVSLTWAILPEAPYAGDYAAMARAKGFEVMLHLPLEPVDRAINPGAGVIRGDWDEARIIRKLEQNLAVAPGAVGVNNHMGSAGTQDRRLMGLLMKTLRQKKLFFVDSRTSPKSVAEEYARNYGVPFARRHVFIDNVPDIEMKKAAMRQLIKLARKEGSAIGIVHVRNGNAAAILAMLPEFAEAGIAIVPVSQLVR